MAFGSQLGSILEGFGEPSWTQVGTKSLQKWVFKSMQKMITFWIALGTDFARFWAPTWLPRRGGRRGVERTFFALGAKMASRALQEDLGTDFGRFLDTILNDF